jgi:predicted nucleotide-binding protein (sugar kinase/HSP70/actin superfamily)
MEFFKQETSLRRIELIHSGVTNIAIVQPFVWIPNHVTGKGMH